MLSRLAESAQKAIDEGTYDIKHQLEKSEKNIIEEIKKNTHASVITEVKFSSPSLGEIHHKSDPVEIARQMTSGGAVGLSVLTQPYFFNGSTQYFSQIRRKVDVPILMKDIIIDKLQIDAAKKLGADIILLIQSLFDKKLVNELDEFIEYAHKKNLLVLLESHTKNEFIESLNTSADLLGINNRNLDTLKIDLKTTQNILSEINERNKIVISESGIKSAEDIRFLHQCGADAFLVGSSIMMSKDIKGLVSNLVSAI